MAYQFQYGYPNFQQNYQQQSQMNFQQPQIQTQPQVQNTGILYVEGDRGAEEFQMLPNTFAFLKSTDGKSVYFKQALANGSVTCEKYILGEMAKGVSNDYVTRVEFEDFVKKMTEPKKNTKEKKDE